MTPLRPAQVLTAATKTDSELRKLDQLGTVAVGKNASFLVLQANPLDNINNTRRIAKVYLNGKQLDRVAMRAMWVDAPSSSR